jgi:acyl-CoA thioesterase-2
MAGHTQEKGMHRPSVYDTLYDKHKEGIMTECKSGETVLAELLELLQLEKIEETIYRGASQDLGFGNIFGGQVLGQSLSAVSQTVPPERSVHSLHGYFLRPGDPRKPIVYKVDCIRDGRSFTTRRAVAIQNGRAIYSMSASFQISEPGFEHQDTAPDVPGPQGLVSELERARQVKERIPEPVRAKLTCDRPLEIRTVNPINPFAPVKKEPDRYAWFKAVDTMPDDPLIHTYMLAYASDFGLVGTALYPHGHTYWEPAMQVASLDHTMWFHREFRMDEWLLYVMHSPSASGARGLSHGRIYTQEGILVASTAQEGLMRYHGKRE